MGRWRDIAELQGIYPIKQRAMLTPRKRKGGERKSKANNA